MKTIGLIGGMSWESSAEYYRIINQAIQRRRGGTSSAQIVLISVDFARIETLQASGDWDRAAADMIAAGHQAQAAGADFLLLCTNTMHRVADTVSEALSIPLLHIADVTAAAITDAGLGDVGLLGTRYTMEQDFYRGRLQEHGVSVKIPDEPDRSLVHDIIYDELVKGVIRPESRATYLSVVDDLVERGCQGLIGGCTEIELLISGADVSIPFFPTAELHALAAVDLALLD
ncbi:MAG: aspartate/glutamate racemase family protein [Acidimicrobiia bacterium]|nr:aspartate/glutamate racemase family protein [Acidimicrobiia bacterium]